MSAGGGKTVLDPVGPYPPLSSPNGRIVQYFERGRGQSQISASYCSHYERQNANVFCTQICPLLLRQSGRKQQYRDGGRVNNSTRGRGHNSTRGRGHNSTRPGRIIPSPERPSGRTQQYQLEGRSHNSARPRRAIPSSLPSRREL